MSGPVHKQTPEEFQQRIDEIHGTATKSAEELNLELAAEELAHEMTRQDLNDALHYLAAVRLEFDARGECADIKRMRDYADQALQTIRSPTGRPPWAQ